MNKSTQLNNTIDRKIKLKLRISRNAVITTEDMHICLNLTKLTRPALNSGVIKYENKWRNKK